MKFRLILCGLLLCILPAGCTAAPVPEETPSYRQITQEEAQKILKEETGYILLDVRTEEEWNEGHIPGSICIPNETIGAAPLPQLSDKDQMILVYCRSGRRSKLAAEKLAAQGYRNVLEFGGIITWTGAITHPMATE